MFYDHKLMTNSPLREPWRAAHGQMLNQNGNSEQILNICEGLAELMPNDECSRRNRLSLRTSAFLLNGVARLYETEMNRLLQDVSKLEDEIVFGKNRRIEDSKDAPQASTTELPRGHNNDKRNVRCGVMVPSKYLNVSNKYSEDDLEVSVDVEIDESSTEILISLGNSRSMSSPDTLNGEEPGDEDWDEFERICDRTCSDIQCSNLDTGSNVDGKGINNVPVLQTSTVEESTPNTYSEIKNDKAIQTSDHFNAEESNNEERNYQFDRNLPYALLMIHENNESLAPSKILLTNVHPSVKHI